jgi:hypothetical protein
MFYSFLRYQEKSSGFFIQDGVTTINVNHVSSLTMIGVRTNSDVTTILRVIMSNGVRHYLEPQDYDKFHQIFNGDN